MLRNVDRSRFSICARERIASYDYAGSDSQKKLTLKKKVEIIDDAGSDRHGKLTMQEKVEIVLLLELGCIAARGDVSVDDRISLSSLVQHKLPAANSERRTVSS